MVVCPESTVNRQVWRGGVLLGGVRAMNSPLELSATVALAYVVLTPMPNFVVLQQPHGSRHATMVTNDNQSEAQRIRGAGALRSVTPVDGLTLCQHMHTTFMPVTLQLHAARTWKRLP